MNPLYFTIIFSAVSLIVTLIGGIFAANWSNQRMIERIMDAHKEMITAHLKVYETGQGAMREEMNLKLEAIREEMKLRLEAMREETTLKLEAMRGEMNQRFDKLEGVINARFDTVNTRLSGLEERLSRLELHPVTP